MKKRIINGILMVALIGATASSFVSCKDTDDDLRTDFESALADQNSKLKDRIDSLTENAKYTITGVTVNATSTSILQNSKLFPGFNAQFLGATYGKAAYAFSFPTVDGAKVGKIEFGANKLIYNEKNTIFFTVNPTSVDLPWMVQNKNLKLALIDSKNNSYFSMGTPATAAEALRWGTRSTDGTTTLWQSTITLDDATLQGLGAFEAGNIVNAQVVAEHIKAVINEAKGVNRTSASVKAATKNVVTEAASLIAENLQAVVKEATKQQKALALKAQWDDKYVGTRAEVSDYSIAAAGFKPLDFYYGQNNLTGVTFTFDRLNNAIAKIIKKVREQFPAKMGNVTITVSYDATGKFKITGVPTGATYNETSKTITLETADQDLSQAINDVIKAINDGIDVTTINNMIADVNKLIDSANNTADRAENWSNRVTNFLNDLVSRILTKVENEGLYVILQPVLLDDTQSGIRRVAAGSTLKAGKHTFIPTTLTSELLAPAYAKYVAVKQNGAIVEDQIKVKGQEGFNAFEFDDLKAGDATIIYQAVDFYGNIVTKEYNVTVQ
jgi:hypothetical protein